MKEPVVYKVCDRKLWDKAKANGLFEGAEIDLSDGFIHFSTKEQVASTLAKHFAGREGLVIVAVDADAVGSIVYEEARGGALFPHLYEPLQMADVMWTKDLPLDDAGIHKLPEL